MRRLRLFRGLVAASGLLFAFGALTPKVAAADPPPFPFRADRLETPGSNGASDDGARGLVLNPATLAYQPGWEVRALVQAARGTDGRASGVALDYAVPVFGAFGLGLRLENSTAPSAFDKDPYFANSFSWATLGVGFKSGRNFAFGASLEGGGSGRGALNGLGQFTVGGLYRPNPYFSAGLSAHLTNQRYSDVISPISGVSVLEDRLRGSLVLRPDGTRAFEIGLDTKYYVTSKDLVPRATIAATIPGVGRARADLEAQKLFADGRRSVVGSVGIEFSLSQASAGGGLLVGNGLGGDGIAPYFTASMHGYTEPGMPTGHRFVAIRIEKTPGVRGHVRLLRTLWALAEDPTIDGVALQLKASPASSLAHAEEVADALRVLRAHGKKSFCALEDGTGTALFACASADRIVMNPAGGLRYAGLKSQRMYLKGLLDKLGVKAEFVRIGAHKSAPEQFTNEHASETSRRDQEDLLKQTEAVFVENLVRYRKLTPEWVRAETLKGPFIASEARAAKFIDGFAYDDELEKVAREVAGHPVRYVPYEAPQRMPETFGRRGSVAVLYIDGDMVDGRSQKVPLLGEKMVGSYTIVDAVKALKADPDVKAVVLRVETPGGSSLAADVMWRELRLLGERKPLIISMGSIAASGGYYIASAGSRIYANPLTITGSIGIFYGKADTSGLLGKIGVNIDTIRTAPRADAESLYRGFSDDERVELSRKVGQFYDVFLGRVAEGRKMTKDQVDAVGQGRVWAGQQAKERGLVDELGGLRHALEAARMAAHLPPDAPIVEGPEETTSLAEKALALAGAKASSTGLPPMIEPVLRAAAPFAYHPADVPLARTDWVDLETLNGSDDD